MRSRGHAQGGFSLLEVIVAFAIAAIALGVLSQIFGHGARNLAVARDYDEALMLADSLLAEYGTNVTSNETSISAEAGQFRWLVSFEPYITREPTLDLASAAATEALNRSQLIQINVSVNWQRNGKSRSIDVSSLRFVVDDDNATAFSTSL